MFNNAIHKKYKENNTKECHYQIVKTWYKDKNLETGWGGNTTHKEEQRWRWQQISHQEQCQLEEQHL